MSKLINASKVAGIHLKHQQGLKKWDISGKEIPRAPSIDRLD